MNELYDELLTWLFFFFSYFLFLFLFWTLYASQELIGFHRNESINQWDSLYYTCLTVSYVKMSLPVPVLSVGLVRWVMQSQVVEAPTPFYLRKSCDLHVKFYSVIIKYHSYHLSTFSTKTRNVGVSSQFCRDLSRHPTSEVEAEATGSCNYPRPSSWGCNTQWGSRVDLI